MAKIVLTQREVALLAVLASHLDPTKYDKASTRALIERCKAVTEDPDGRIGFRIVRG